MPAPQEHVTTSPEPLTPLGNEQETDLSTVKSLGDIGSGIPAGATFAFVQAETQDIRFTDDGQDPTASFGTLILENQVVKFTGDLSVLKFIEAVAGAKMNIIYEGY